MIAIVAAVVAGYFYVTQLQTKNALMEADKVKLELAVEGLEKDPQLEVCKWSKPRVMDEWVIKPYTTWKDKSYKDYTDAERSVSDEVHDEFIRVCMEHPIDTKSDIN